MHNDLKCVGGVQDDTELNDDDDQEELEDDSPKGEEDIKDEDDDDDDPHMPSVKCEVEDLDEHEIKL